MGPIHWLAHLSMSKAMGEVAEPPVAEHASDLHAEQSWQISEQPGYSIIASWLMRGDTLLS